MKYIYKILIAFIAVLAVSCDGDDVEKRTIVNAVSTAEVSSPATGQAYILDVNKAAGEGAKFEWSPAKYSSNVVVEYTVLIDKKGGDFTAAKTLATTKNVTKVSVLVRELNQAALN